MNPDGFRADILSEPEVLASMAAGYGGGGSPLAALPPLAGKRLLLIGMGSSKYAADSAVALLRGRGIDAHSELASADPAHAQPPSRDTVAFVISASGRSEETVEAMRRHLGMSHVVAVTNRADRVLAAEADSVLDVMAGAEAGGVACKSYQCTLAALLLVAGRALGSGGPAPDDVRLGAECTAGLIGSRERWLEPLVGLVDAGLGVWVSGPAERIASVQQSALMLREGPRIVADACETGDWLHVDLYLTRRSGYTMLLLSGSRYDHEVMRWQRKRGFAVAAVGGALEGVSLQISHPAADALVPALLAETVVAELLAAELWLRRRHSDPALEPEPE